MSVFSKLFGRSKEREIKRLFADTQKKVEKEYKPIGEIGRAIVTASTNSRNAVKDLIQAPTEKERQEQEIYIFYEFISFFMHLTMRQAFAQLTEPQVEKLQAYLGPLMASVAIDSYFAHWPDDMKEKMMSEFYEKLNQAELEYTESTQFDSAKQGDNRLTQKLRSLFMRLGSNISSLSGNGESDIAVVMPVVEIAINEWKKMELDKVIVEVKRVN
jgi:hypothetical protein